MLNGVFITLVLPSKPSVPPVCHLTAGISRCWRSYRSLVVPTVDGKDYRRWSSDMNCRGAQPEWRAEVR